MFNESYERDHALATIRAINRTTPEDAGRDLARLLSHVIPTMVDGEYEAHREQGCDVCHRAVVWLPIINGLTSSL